jgi:hypothetical protein
VKIFRLSDDIVDPAPWQSHADLLSPTKLAKELVGPREDVLHCLAANLQKMRHNIRAGLKPMADMLADRLEAAVTEIQGSF